MSVRPLEIRREASIDIAGIWQLHATAFPTLAEANLVTMLRDEGDAILSLVAVADAQVVGHALFSKMRLPPRCLGLAPVAVQASLRRRGIADRLIRAKPVFQAPGSVIPAPGGWSTVFTTTPGAAQ